MLDPNRTPLFYYYWPQKLQKAIAIFPIPDSQTQELKKYLFSIVTKKDQVLSQKMTVSKAVSL